MLFDNWPFLLPVYPECLLMLLTVVKQNLNIPNYEAYFEPS